MLISNLMCRMHTRSPRPLPRLLQWKVIRNFSVFVSFNFQANLSVLCHLGLVFHFYYYYLILNLKKKRKKKKGIFTSTEGEKYQKSDNDAHCYFNGIYIVSLVWICTLKSLTLFGTQILGRKGKKKKKLGGVHLLLFGMKGKKCSKKVQEKFNVSLEDLELLQKDWEQ